MLSLSTHFKSTQYNAMPALKLIYNSYESCEVVYENKFYIKIQKMTSHFHNERTR